jgi:hypothetical protein
MTKEQVALLPNGLYRIHWKEKHGGGTSLAAVGILHSGERWLAPTNWTCKDGDNPTGYGRKTWKAVEKAELLYAKTK